MSVWTDVDDILEEIPDGTDVVSVPVKKVFFSFFVFFHVCFLFFSWKIIDQNRAVPVVCELLEELIQRRCFYSQDSDSDKYDESSLQWIYGCVFDKRPLLDVKSWAQCASFFWDGANKIWACISIISTWAIYYLANYPWKLRENKRVGKGGGRGASGALPKSGYGCIEQFRKPRKSLCKFVSQANFGSKY